MERHLVRKALKGKNQSKQQQPLESWKARGTLANQAGNDSPKPERREEPSYKTLAKPTQG